MAITNAQVRKKTIVSDQRSEVKVRKGRMFKGSEGPDVSRSSVYARTHRPTYSETLRGQSNYFAATMEEDEDDVSDDDVVEDLGDESCFSMGMARQEKIEARRPWRTSLFIKLYSRMKSRLSVSAKEVASYVENSILCLSY